MRTQTAVTISEPTGNPDDGIGLPASARTVCINFLLFVFAVSSCHRHVSHVPTVLRIRSFTLTHRLSGALDFFSFAPPVVIYHTS